MELKIYQVDVFTTELFKGNPAAVCMLDHWPDDSTMAAIAAENNLSETAFVVTKGAEFPLRWFTPKVEAGLCGHATLAAGFVVTRVFDEERDTITFATASGSLEVTDSGDLFAVDLPRWETQPAAPPDDVAEALGVTPSESRIGEREYMFVVDSPAQLREVTPDLRKIAAWDREALVTCKGDGRFDFEVRYFAPGAGIGEDPVTGSAQCIAAPYWADKLRKPDLVCYQASARGGVIQTTVREDRVRIAGSCVHFMSGVVHMPL